MTAQHHSQIARQENTLGRHYSHFPPRCRLTRKQNQSLPQLRSLKNRRRYRRIG